MYPSTLENLYAENPYLDTTFKQVELKGDRKSGAEHWVWLDRNRGVVRKVLSDLGRLWQTVDSECAERDYWLMQEVHIPVVLTEILANCCANIEGSRRRFTYILQQPLFENSHPLTYADLLDFRQHREKLFEIVSAGQQIRRKFNLGLDLLGGKALTLIPNALNPMVPSMEGAISNLLVADEEIRTTCAWPDDGVKIGEVIAKKGDLVQCDTRMYDFNREGITGEMTKMLLLKLQDAQDSALWTILESLGYVGNFDFQKTISRRMSRAAIMRAVPKMIRHAERNR